MKAVIFSLGNKEYGADLSEVREVIRLRPVTHMPDSADFVEGVISLRGRVIPLIDLAVKLGMEKKPSVKTNRIIIIKVDTQLIGVRVDKVAGVVTLDSAQMTHPDELLKTANYVTGMAKIKERLILVMNFAKLLREDMAPQIQRIHDTVEVREKK
ncbi:MAG: purine-binding chemotaxis protein CheW [Candidatus Omnitrophica bacterium]|nr:purine-binding chemotaxis protein CheW [Candidatus Omnitrophota bacterium]